MSSNADAGRPKTAAVFIFIMAIETEHFVELGLGPQCRPHRNTKSHATTWHSVFDSMFWFFRSNMIMKARSWCVAASLPRPVIQRTRAHVKCCLRRQHVPPRCLSIMLQAHQQKLPPRLAHEAPVDEALRPSESTGKKNICMPPGQSCTSLPAHARHVVRGACNAVLMPMFESVNTCRDWLNIHRMRSSDADHSQSTNG